MEYIIIAIIAFYIGYRVSQFIHVLTFNRILEDLGVSTEQIQEAARKAGLEELAEEQTGNSDAGEVTLTPIEIKIEQHGNNLYAYRLDNDQFLGQGTDREQLIQRLTENLTNVRLIISEENGAGHIKSPEKA
jgi:hypothetical protein